MKRKIVVLLLLMSVVLTGCQQKVTLDNKYNGGEEVNEKYNDTNFSHDNGRMSSPIHFMANDKDIITIFRGMNISFNGVWSILELDLDEKRDLKLDVSSKIIDGEAKLVITYKNGDVLEELDLTEVEEAFTCALNEGEYFVKIIGNRVLFEKLSITTKGKIVI